MSKVQVLLSLLVAGCTSSSGPGPSGDDGGDPSVVDAPITTMPLAVNCQPYTRTVVAADGSKTVTTSKYALVDVAPGEHAVVTACYPLSYPLAQDLACPAGATCTGTNYPGSPQDQRCVSTLDGTFIGQKLLVGCGSASQTFNAAGTMTNSTSLDLEHISVVRF